MKKFTLSYGQLANLCKQIDEYLEIELRSIDITKQLDVHNIGSPLASMCSHFISDVANEYYKKELESANELEARIKSELINKITNYLKQDG